MILQAADFTGSYRLPPGPAAADVQAAIRQADLVALQDLFAPDTAAFIAADPTQPPATTLAAGGGGMLGSWAYYVLPFAASRISWALAGYGAPLPAAKGRTVMHVPSVQGLAGLHALREELGRIARTVWQGQMQCIATTPTTSTFAIPQAAWEWLRVGTRFALPQAQVVALPAAGQVTLDIAGFSVGQSVQYRIAYYVRD